MRKIGIATIEAALKGKGHSSRVAPMAQRSTRKDDPRREMAEDEPDRASRSQSGEGTGNRAI
jgi:hypothetical protein